MKKNLLTLDVALSKEIKYMLKEEHYLPGDKLPSERKLAELFHVQRLTVRGALNLLLQDKTIISKPRSGYYVAPKRILQSIRNFSLHSEEDSGQLTYELYDFKKIEADNYLASEMLLPEKSKIYKIVWLYSDGTQPICINTTYIPEYIYPDLTQQIAASAPAIDLITNNRQITLAKSNQKVTLLYADTKTAQILNIPVDSPLMKYKGLMYDKQGHLAVFFENNMLIDRFGFMSNDDVLAAQIKSSIITKIKTQEYLPGELLPSERDFATMYSVSRYLIHDIFDELISQHYLIRVQGKGTFVRKPEQNRVALGVLNESKNASFTSLVRNFGIEISNKCLGTGIIKNRKYFADKLGLSEEDEIYGIHRIRLGNKEPLAIEFTYVPLHFFSDIDNYNFEHISLYDYMKSQNHLPVKFDETMMMVEAGEKLQKHLHLPSATSIVNYIEFIGYDENGNLVEYTESYSRPDKLEVRFVTNDI